MANRDSGKRLNAVACLGLTLGGVFGLAGSFVGVASLRSLAWEIDSLGVIVATAVLAIKYFRKSCDGIAAGFLIFAIGESVMLGGQAAGLEGSAAAFAAGSALWATGLFLISFPQEFPDWVRLAGNVASVLFIITATEIFLGRPLNPLSQPLPFFGYPFLVATFAGWIRTLLREIRAAW